ncbi:MAG: hypothetical protein GWM98_14640, partial [Nitrospinaceae bacterium]|nr:hypothetical protein [Nitrospinaceae bacterium]NIR55481.1 hypothetical protein [Nitrospinaceae bacterium]NIS85921.1 hypothetical protein [Nitrospinaceae bacterium]NIT82769.1 hypothetical protein [Nitrospinaceae bacterium]NIU97140.1 hypothetical protein [Nitrospinaceae bacterium]
LFENLRQLDLRNNLITPQGMDHLLQSPFLKNLEKMDLRLNKLGKRWEEKLKNCGNFPNLKDVHTV